MSTNFPGQQYNASVTFFEARPMVDVGQCYGVSIKNDFAVQTYFAASCSFLGSQSGNERCVSGTYQDKIYSFLDNNNGTAIEINNGILWQKCASGASGSDCQTGTPLLMTWNDALNHCKNLNYLGKTWKLPNINEALSFYERVDEITYDYNIFPFDSTYQEGTWSSTTSNVDFTKAYYTIGRADRNQKLKTDTNRVRCISVVQ
jgi:hypothetical protein